MDKQAYSELRDLQNYGWQVEQGNKIKFNAGGESETLKHIWGKTVGAMICLRNDYYIDTEVVHDSHSEENKGEIDLLAFGHPGRLTYAIEIQHSPDQETMDDKLDRYVNGPIDDMLTVNCSKMPMDLAEAAEYVAGEIGLEL